jgi:hypothetical protein
MHLFVRQLFVLARRARPTYDFLGENYRILGEEEKKRAPVERKEDIRSSYEIYIPSVFFY